MRRTSLLFFTALVINGLTCKPAQAQPKPPVPIPPPSAPAEPPLESFLSFDAEQKEVTVSNGTPQANFVFNLTNISSGEVIINFVKTSCGCTVAKLPSTPWKIAPQESGQISATMNLAGTPPGGYKIKTLTINSDKGNKALYVKATIAPLPTVMTEEDRVNNQKLAMADRQAIFKNDCVKCHVNNDKDAAGNDKMGKDLLVSACDICHETEHQASFVPNLHHLKDPTSPEFWKNWILHGKPGTLMPAFAKSEGGNLTDAQVESLVAYLSATIPLKPPAQITTPVKTVVQ